jgi:hypothetical protein
MSDIDYLKYEKGIFKYGKYNQQYNELLQSTCSSIPGLVDADDMTKTFEEQGTVTFSGDKYTLKKTKTVTVAERCKIMDEYINN